MVKLQDKAAQGIHCGQFSLSNVFVFSINQSVERFPLVDYSSTFNISWLFSSSLGKCL